MDWNAPMQALWSYFHGNNDGNSQQSDIQAQQQLGLANTQALQGMLQGGVPFHGQADKPPKGEATVKFYPTKDYIEPTETNKGTAWAPLQMPVTSFTSLAKAHAEALDKNIIPKETADYILSGATREGRWDDYGVNHVAVNYYSPPPKHLQPMVENSNRVAAEINQLKKAEERSVRLGDTDSSVKYRTKRKGLEADLTLLDEMILKDEKWTGTGPYNELSRKAELLGIPRSTNQEIVRDPETGKLKTKVDVYRPTSQMTQDERAKYVPFALANKSQELGGRLKGLPVYQAFIGGGKEARIRAAQQSEMHDYITQHPKNRDSNIAYRKTMESFRRNK